MRGAVFLRCWGELFVVGFIFKIIILVFRNVICDIIFRGLLFLVGKLVEEKWVVKCFLKSVWFYIKAR